jgi:hypothetical protein
MTVVVALRQNQSTDLNWSQIDGNFIALASAINASAPWGIGPVRPASPMLGQPWIDSTLGPFGLPILCAQVTPAIVWINFSGVSV